MPFELLPIKSGKGCGSFSSEIPLQQRVLGAFKILKNSALRDHMGRKTRNNFQFILFIIALIASFSCKESSETDTSRPEITVTNFSDFGTEISLNQSYNIDAASEEPRFYTYTPTETDTFYLDLSHTGSINAVWDTTSDFNSEDQQSCISECSSMYSTCDYTCDGVTLKSGVDNHVKLSNPVSGESNNVSFILTKDLGQGDDTSPVSLTLGTSITAGIGKSKYSYYQFTSSDAGSYKVKLGNESNTMSIEPKSGDDYTSETPSSCVKTNLTYYFNEVGANSTKTFRINGNEASQLEFTLLGSKSYTEGSTSSPISLTVGDTHSGGGFDPISQCGTGSTSSSNYYSFTPSTSGNHTITLSSTSLTANISLYNNSSFSTLHTSCSSSSSCAVSSLTSGTTYYLKITNSQTLENGSYDIAVTKD